MGNWTPEQFVAVMAKMQPPQENTPDIADPGLEKTLLGKCLNQCREWGYPAWHDFSKKVNEPGWSDLFIFMPMRLIVLIELKAEKGTFRKEQKEKRLILHFLGHHVYQAKSFKRFNEIICHEEALLEKRGWKEGQPPNLKGEL